ELTFQKPDFSVFRGLAIAFKAGRAGGSMPTVFNAANEMAVSKFLNREISYLEIPEMIEYAMSKHKLIKNPSIDEILVTEQETYDTINSKWR
ncbi:MAG: 1-deoxy-D-xylulose-5-phosphate reductoisomerase, partial [Clostridiales bacterium]|nr:1-deoxy-D-xylulose-5-phosphate reductoisomerase [Clostridiales bacterium]